MFRNLNFSGRRKRL